MNGLVVGPIVDYEVHRLSGDPVSWPATCPNPDLVIAVDSGLEVCQLRGWRADIVVGDFDSLNAEVFEAIKGGDIQIERHPTDKDYTDLDAALDLAVERGVTSITAVGFIGGRLDHQLAVLGSLAVSRGASVVALGPSCDAGQPPECDVVTILWPGDDAQITPGGVFSVMALSGSAEVSIHEARWPLTRHVLSALSSHGLSNESGAEGAKVRCDSGVVAVIVP